jgi:hypothetical protein
LLLSAGAQAQGTDIFVGYSYGALEAGNTSSTNAAKGLAFSLGRNFGPYFAWTTDFGTQIGNTNDALLALSPLRGFTTMQIFTGPQINIRVKKVNVFVRALGGIVREDLDGFTLSSVDCALPGIDCTALGGTLLGDGSFTFPGTQTARFAMNYGTGVEAFFNKHFGLRLIQLDYMPVRTSDPNRNWRQNARLASGIVVRF